MIIMSKEIFKNPELEGRKVRFDVETMCALERGFEKNPEAAKELEGIVGERLVKLFKDILYNALDPKNRAPITFVPGKDEAKIVYSQIAKRELERIDAEDEDDEDLSCGHTVEDHIHALQNVVEKMEPTVN